MTAGAERAVGPIPVRTDAVRHIPAYVADKDRHLHIAADLLAYAVDYERLDFALNPRKELCARCGLVARGSANIGNLRYCHPNSNRHPDCYSLACHAPLDGIPFADLSWES